MASCKWTFLWSAVFQRVVCSSLYRTKLTSFSWSYQEDDVLEFVSYSIICLNGCWLFSFFVCVNVFPLLESLFVQAHLLVTEAPVMGPRPSHRILFVLSLCSDSFQVRFQRRILELVPGGSVKVSLSVPICLSGVVPLTRRALLYVSLLLDYSFMNTDGWEILVLTKSVLFLDTDTECARFPLRLLLFLFSVVHPYFAFPLLPSSTFKFAPTCIVIHTVFVLFLESNPMWGKWKSHAQSQVLYKTV